MFFLCNLTNSSCHRKCFPFSDLPYHPALLIKCQSTRIILQSPQGPCCIKAWPLPLLLPPFIFLRYIRIWGSYNLTISISYIIFSITRYIWYIQIYWCNIFAVNIHIFWQIDGQIQCFDFSKSFLNPNILKWRYIGTLQSILILDRRNQNEL